MEKLQTTIYVKDSGYSVYVHREGERIRGVFRYDGKDRETDWIHSMQDNDAIDAVRRTIDDFLSEKENNKKENI